MAEDESEFDQKFSVVQKYLKVETEEQFKLRSLISKIYEEIDKECKAQTDKAPEQRLLRVKLAENNLELKQLLAEARALEGNQYTEDVRRGGVLCSSNLYGCVYIAKNCDLYIVPIENFAARADILHVKSFPTNITQLALSSSELLLSVTLSDTIEIFEASALQQNVSMSGAHY